MGVGRAGKVAEGTAWTKRSSGWGAPGGWGTGVRVKLSKLENERGPWGRAAWRDRLGRGEVAMKHRLAECVTRLSRHVCSGKALAFPHLFFFI